MQTRGMVDEGIVDSTKQRANLAEARQAMTSCRPAVEQGAWVSGMECPSEAKGDETAGRSTIYISTAGWSRRENWYGTTLGVLVERKSLIIRIVIVVGNERSHEASNPSCWGPTGTSVY